MSAAEGVARRIDDGGPDVSMLADSLYVRYCVQDTRIHCRVPLPSTG
ncbi:hypothetical protein ACIPXV_27160 [Streptomyces libani]